MAFAFTRAARVATGAKITSTHLRSLARAINDRLRSGLGDGLWRLVYYGLKLWEQVRNPSADGNLWPARAEFFHAYQMLDPGAASYPVTGPGDPEGSNLASPLPLYIWGNTAAGIGDESWRLSEVPLTLPDGRRPSTISEIRTLGKLQRGAADLRTGASIAPAWLAARSWDVIRPDWARSVHLSAYGGWQAAPDQISPDCEDPNPFDEFPPPPNYEIRFTATEAGQSEGYADKVYAGTCQIGIGVSADYSLHVATVVNAPWAWYVVLNNGTVDVLPKAYYVPGPYYGVPRLRKTEGDQLPRVLQAWASEWRGVDQNMWAKSALTDGAASKPHTWLAGAFDAQWFFTRQYGLSPARGRQVTGGIEALYPAFRMAAPTDRLALSAGTVIPTQPGLAASHRVNTSCAVPMAWVKATALVGSATVEVLSNNAVRGMATLTDAQPEALVPLTVDCAAGERIGVRLASTARFSAATGRIDAELDELLDYKPDMSDWFLVNRLTTGQ